MTEPHAVAGVGEETVVICGHDGNAYGPGGDTMPQKCPYCGGNARGGDHRIILDGDEVLCENTGQSTYRYCPGCGEEVGSEDRGDELCQLCKTLEVEIVDEIRNEATGETTIARLCRECWDKGVDHHNGKDVDFSDELRLHTARSSTDTVQRDE